MYIYVCMYVCIYVCVSIYIYRLCFSLRTALRLSHIHFQACSVSFANFLVIHLVVLTCLRRTLDLRFGSPGLGDWHQKELAAVSTSDPPGAINQTNNQRSKQKKAEARLPGNRTYKQCPWTLSLQTTCTTTPKTDHHPCDCDRKLAAATAAVDLVNCKRQKQTDAALEKQTSIDDCENKIP